MSVRLYVCLLVCDNFLFTSQDNTALLKGNNIQSFKNNTRYNILQPMHSDKGKLWWLHAL